MSKPGDRATSWWQSAAIVIAALTFLSRFERVEQRWIDGHLVASYRNWGWVIGGGLVIACALLALIDLARTPPRRRGRLLGVSAVEVAVGAYLGATGLGCFYRAADAPVDLDASSSGDAPTPGEALARYQGACAAGSLPACEGALRVLDAMPQRTEHEDRQRRALAAQACRLDGAAACDGYARMLDDGDGGSARPDLAAAVARRACHLGRALRCRPGDVPSSARVRVVKIEAVDADAYEPVPLLDDLSSRLAPCAALPDAAAVPAALRITVEKAGKVTVEPGDGFALAAAVRACIVEHAPTRADTVAMSIHAEDRQTFDVSLRLGTPPH
jgi:hypothetical protein